MLPSDFFNGIGRLLPVENARRTAGSLETAEVRVALLTATPNDNHHAKMPSHRR
jgi:hypothetical protein